MIYVTLRLKRTDKNEVEQTGTAEKRIPDSRRSMQSYTLFCCCCCCFVVVVLLLFFLMKKKKTDKNEAEQTRTAEKRIPDSRRNIQSSTLAYSRP